MKTTFRTSLSSLCLSTCAVLSAQMMASPSPAQSTPIELRQEHIGNKFKFIAYGDTRFTVAPDPVVSNAPVRRELVSAIAHVHPAFIVMSGDIVYNGSDPGDWQDFDRETEPWRSEHIPLYPRSAIMRYAAVSNPASQTTSTVFLN